MFNINKLNRFVSSFFLATLFLVTIGIVPQQFAQSLVGHWAMEENSGASVLVDSSTYGHDATISGGDLSQVDGQRGYAQQFVAASSDYAFVEDNSNLDITGDLTLAAWIKPDNSGTMSIIKKNGDGTGYELYCGSAGYVYLRLNGPANTYRATSNSSYPTDGSTWMHVAATYNGTTKDMKIYINGNYEVTATGPNAIILNDNQLRIGQDSYQSKLFNGAIDDARVYSSVLELAEIQTLITTWDPPPPPPLVGHWAMEENSGASVLVDSSTYGHDATISGGDLSQVDGQRGYAQQFVAASSDYAFVEDNSNLDITGDLTLAAWIKPDNSGTMSIIKKNGDGTGYELYCGSAGYVYLRLNGPANTYRATSNSSYPTDGSTWMHVAATYNGTTKDMKIYINGNYEVTATGPNAIILNDNQLRIGQDSYQSKLFNGAIDDARVYSSVLELAEIQTLITTWDPPSPPPPLVGHWAMEENSGVTVLVDSSSYGHDATVSGGGLAQVDGQRGYAQNFDYSNDYAAVGDHSDFDITGDLTLAAWIKPNRQGTMSIIKKNGTGSGYGLYCSATDPGYIMMRLNSDNAYRAISTTIYPNFLGTWIHVAATYDGTSKNMKMYINGTLEHTLLTGPASIVTNNNELRIGRDALSTGTKYFDGAIDDARVYNIALSQAEIQALVTTWDPPPPPLPAVPGNFAAAAQSFFEIQLSWEDSDYEQNYEIELSTNGGSTFSPLVTVEAGVTTYTNTNLDAETQYCYRIRATNSAGESAYTSVKCATTAAEPTVEGAGAGKALDFDDGGTSGTSDYVDCGNGTSLDITQSLTVEAWISSSTYGTQSILKKFESGKGYELFLEGPSPYRVSIRLNGTSNTHRVYSTTPYPIDGSWMHVAGTFDNSTNKIKLYVNGIQEGDDIDGPGLIGSTTNSLVIGSDLTDFTKGFKGRLDEIRVWDDARTPAQIRDNMCKKLTGTESGLVGYWRFDEVSGDKVVDETSNNNHGTLTNMSPASDRVNSGAAIGDASVIDFDGADGYSANLSHTDGDDLTASTTGGTITGIQVYRVDDAAERTGSTVPANYELDPLRYWGVNVIGTSANYDVVYNYSGHPGIGVETDLRLVKRNNLSDDNWVDTGAALDDVAKTLTLTGETGTEYALASTSESLPVELSSFKAILTSGVVTLNWQTKTEVNNYGFEVERASSLTTPRQDEWSTIGFVDGYGNSNSPKEYSFTDNNPAGGTKFNYRLKQMDNDGAYEYSDIVEVELAPTEFALYQNYPNPFNPTTRIKYSIPKESIVTIKVYDILGNEVKTLVSEKQEQGNYEIDFSANSGGSNLVSGIYFYQMQAGTFSQVNKMLILK